MCDELAMYAAFRFQNIGDIGRGWLKANGLTSLKKYEKFRAQCSQSVDDNSDFARMTPFHHSTGT